MINIRLDPKTIDYVRQEADRKGIGPTQLIRMWIKERINESRPSSVGT
jgi:antitoxin component of RelBE/YafQ-DinJ toxin-antitoxin module